MARIIINNKSRLTDVDVMYFVSRVVSGGRISTTRFGPSYCYVTSWETVLGDKPGVVVYANRNAKSDTFTVMDYEAKA